MLWAFILIDATCWDNSDEYSQHICNYKEIDIITLTEIWSLQNCLTVLIGVCAVTRLNMVYCIVQVEISYPIFLPNILWCWRADWKVLIHDSEAGVNLFNIHICLTTPCVSRADSQYRKIILILTWYRKTVTLTLWCHMTWTAYL